MSTQVGQELALEKAPTGIRGFDEITRGGLPRGRVTLVLGGPGAGKTVFALQALVAGARDYGEPAIFVAFEENSRQIVANAATFGWDLPALERDHLFFLDAHISPQVVQAGQFDLEAMLAALGAKAADMGARRIVFDGLDVTYELQGTFEPRDYCVQYRETDFNFASRMMEEEGIYYYFVHDNDKHTMVVANTPQSHRPLPDAADVIYEEVFGGKRDEDRILAWEKTQELRPGTHRLWDHCFELPYKHLEADAARE
jgi:KaiC/GvpD/RAD55 family RecA-like ATPase